MADGAQHAQPLGQPPGPTVCCFAGSCASGRLTKYRRHEASTHGLMMCRDALILVLSNGFAIGCIVAIVLHLIIPEEDDHGQAQPEVSRIQGWDAGPF